MSIAVDQDGLKICPAAYLDREGRVAEKFLVCHGQSGQFATRTEAEHIAPVFDTREKAAAAVAEYRWVVPEKCTLVLPFEVPTWTSYTVEGYTFHVICDDFAGCRRMSRNPAHIALSMSLRDPQIVDWVKEPVGINYLRGPALLLVENAATHTLIPYNSGRGSVDAGTLFRRVFAHRVARLADYALTHILTEIS